ncbi:MAG: BON domain-containing protein [Gemmatimonadales bacterium]
MNRDDYTYWSRAQGGSPRNFSDREDQWQGWAWTGQPGYGYGQSSYPQGGYGQGYQSGQQWSPGQYGYQGFQGGGYGQGGFGPGFRQFGEGSESWRGREFGRGYEGQSGIKERGHYAGRGPKGYKRSDERIREDINEELTRHPDIDAFEIEVRVDDGEVTLTGTVEDRHAKRLAEDLAERFTGVTDVHNQLHVRQGLREKISSLVTGESPEEQRRASERETSESRPRSGRSAT